MTSSELWNKFINKYNIKNKSYEEWKFGVDPDKLLDLVLKGKKTGTSSLKILYELDNEQLPKVDDYSVILDSNNIARCIIKNIKVEIIPFNKITRVYAFKEGEGDKSLNYYKLVHEDFFRKELEEYNICFSHDMEVVFEEFFLVYKE